jgi:hypothetical protein
LSNGLAGEALEPRDNFGIALFVFSGKRRHENLSFSPSFRSNDGGPLHLIGENADV